MEADKGRTTKAVFIRLSVQEYEWLLERSKELGVAGYIREMVKRAYAKRLAVQENSQPVIERLPLYNPAVHRAGDKVLVRKGKRFIEAVVPELDGDGQAIPKV